MSVGQPVSLPEVLDSHAAAVKEDLHTAMPAVVVSYNAANRTAVVQPQVKLPVFDADGNLTDHLELPILSDVPVAFFRGGGFFFAWPLAAGDGLMLQFSESAMGQWRTSGQVSEPVDVARHSLGYPVAYPVLSPDTMPFLDEAADGMYIGKENDPAQIKFVAGTISLVPTATAFVALASYVDDRLTKIQSTFDGHIHPTPSGASSVTGTLIGTLASVAAAHVKAA